MSSPGSNFGLGSKVTAATREADMRGQAGAAAQTAPAAPPATAASAKASDGTVMGEAEC